MTVSLKDLAYAYIRDRLLDGRIEPGTRISSRGLAKQIGVSFIPVREAITQLAAEGLIDHEPGIGSYAARVRSHDLSELYALREALEVHAILLAAERIDEDSLAEVSRWNDALREIARMRRDKPEVESTQQDLKAWVLADLELHLALLRSAGNARLVRAVKALRVLTQVFKSQRVLRPVADLERACDHHQNLIDALRERDAERAQTVLVEHIRFGCKNALESYEIQRSRSAS
jgi:DNA-binding GntR family transcriptional regulator